MIPSSIDMSGKFLETRDLAGDWKDFQETNPILSNALLYIACGTEPERLIAGMGATSAFVELDGESEQKYQEAMQVLQERFTPSETKIAAEVYRISNLITEAIQETFGP